MWSELSYEESVKILINNLSDLNRDKKLIFKFDN